MKMTNVRGSTSSPRTLVFFFISLLFFIRPVGAAELENRPGRLTLADSYRMALKQSEEIALRGEFIRESEGRFLQALSGVLPKVSFSSTDKYQDGNGGNAFTRRHLPERKFTLSQPLFSGFKEFAALHGSKSEKQLRELEKRRAEQLLFVDVSDAYHRVVELREDVQVLDSIRETLRRRREELQGREKIGRSRGSELVAVQAQLYRVESDWELAQSREAIAVQLLGFLTGQDAIGELETPEPALPPAEPEQAYLSQAAERADVKAAEQSLELFKQQLKVARAGYFPTVDAEGNYYVDRAGIAEQIKWDASLNVDVPIFEGGRVLGENKEAQSQLRQAELRLQQARRVALHDVQDAYTLYEGTLARVRALTKALEATEESYQLEEQEYRLNLVSNLEVLSTLQTLQDARRDLINLLYEGHRAYWRLRTAAGEPVPFEVSR